MTEFLHILALVNTIMIGVTNGQVKKNKLCVQMELEEYHSNNSVIKELITFDKNKCISECVRSGSCRAIHYKPTEKTCELLEATDSQCMVENVAPGVQFVQLTTCSFQLPVRARRPENNGWRWDTYPATMADAVSVRSPLGRNRYVGKLFYHGMYLPGHRTDTPASAGLPDGSNVNCPRDRFQHLIFNASVEYQWVSFFAGDRIPPNAVIGGYWADHSALYVVYVIVGDINMRIPAYYNADTERVYPTLDIRSHEMHMLIVIL